MLSSLASGQSADTDSGAVYLAAMQFDETTNSTKSVPPSGSTHWLNTMQFYSIQLTHRLNQLEELVVSNNRIQSLPQSIGRLENMKILLTDVNALTRLPSTIGQCKSMRILNAASNNLLSLPEEIGQLKELRVINLANNYLRYLPQTIAQLPNLTALWLNDNQKKPLVVLQVDHDEKTNNQVLTCFMFPQTGPIFGPVSPAAAAALAAQAANAIPKQQRAGPVQQLIPGCGQQVVLGIQQKQQQQEASPVVSQLVEPPQTRPLATTAHRQLPNAPSSRLLDEDEDSRGELLQMSNTLDKSVFSSVSDQQQHPMQTVITQHAGVHHHLSAQQNPSQLSHQIGPPIQLDGSASPANWN